MADNAAQGAGENPRAVARARFVRVTPMKARRVIELIKGRPAAEALTILRFAPQAASEPVAKVLASAIANAENNLQLDPGTLVVSAAWADEGPTLKRFQPRAQGRAFRIRKRTSHITIEVESVPRAGASTSRNRRAARVGASTAPASAPTSSKGSAS